jgi:hypothetical protein
MLHWWYIGVSFSPVPWQPKRLDIDKWMLTHDLSRSDSAIASSTARL